jgi:predicted peptidase
MRLLRTCSILLVLFSSAASQSKDAVLRLKDGTEMRYGISVPKSARANQPVPLVIALHYAWNGPRPSAYYGKEFMTLLIEPGLRKLGAIIAAPDCPGQNWTNPKSEEAILELIADLQSRYPVDRSRIVITGFSLGGFGTWYMAALHPEIFSAAIPIAGRPRPEWIGKIDRLPMFVIHSRNDAVVPLEPTAHAVEELTKRGTPVEFLVVDGLGHYDTPSYAEYLGKAVPWMKRVWAKR